MITKYDLSEGKLNTRRDIQRDIFAMEFLNKIFKIFAKKELVPNLHAWTIQLNTDPQCDSVSVHLWNTVDEDDETASVCWNFEKSYDSFGDDSFELYMSFWNSREIFHLKVFNDLSPDFVLYILDHTTKYFADAGYSY